MNSIGEHLAASPFVKRGAKKKPADFNLQPICLLVRFVEIRKIVDTASLRRDDRDCREICHHGCRSGQEGWGRGIVPVTVKHQARGVGRREKVVEIFKCTRKLKRLDLHF